MEITRINHIENLELYLEHDDGWKDFPPDLLDIEFDCSCRLILNASSSEKQQKQENIYCIFVEPEYDGTLSSGQRELYQALLELQQTTVYAIVIVEQLMNKLGLKTPMPVLKRLENLQYLKAISGLKV